MGIKKARAVLDSGHQYTSQDQENMEQFFLQHASSKRVKNEAWLEGEDFLPEGWKYKINTGPNGDYSKLLSPQGEAFNKAGALSHMILFGYPQDQVDKMHASLVYDGWEESSLLPKDWMYRKCKSGRNEYNFLTHMGELFPSKVTLVSYMTKEGIYTDQDIQNVGILRKELKAKWISGYCYCITDENEIARFNLTRQVRHCVVLEIENNAACHGVKGNSCKPAEWSGIDNGHFSQFTGVSEDAVKLGVVSGKDDVTI